jgi:folate-binding protein YgfZ
MATNISLPQESAAKPDFGDVNFEFAALVWGCGIFDSTMRGKFGVTGKDRVRWLNGMVSNNVRDLAAGRGVYSFVLNPQGHIQGDLYAYQRGESLLLDISRSQVEKLLPLLKRYIIMDDVKLADASLEIASIGLTGPKSQEVLGRAGIEAPALEPLQFVELKSGLGDVTLLRGDNSSVNSFELWLSPENAPAMYATLLQNGASQVGTASLDLLRIACGIPEYGKDIRDRDLPQETGQDRALNFTKGCFIGQEIVERIRARGAVHRRFGSFYVDGALPAAGTKIQSEGKDVGEVTSATLLPADAGSIAIALGYLRREALVPGKLLEAGGAKLLPAELPLKEVFSH